LPSTPESTNPTQSPGIVRRLWWRTSQRKRLAIMCLGVCTSIVTTGAAGFMGDALPPEHGSGGPGAAMHRGDAFEVTVHTVSDVDLFEGREPATGLLVHARVAGLSRLTACWAAESRATAQDLLRGKKVRLIVKKDGIPGSDRVPVDVRLPDGTDYAQTIVREGVAPADLSVRDELASVESVARQERRGLWAAGCATGEPTTSSAPSSSSPTSSSPSPTTTTTSPATTETSAQPTHEPPVTTTTAPPSSDPPDEDARVGKPCLVEGSRTSSPSGGELVCARNARKQLRWRRED